MDKNKQFYYRNVLFTFEKFASQILPEKTEKEISEIIEILERKGLINYIETESKEQEALRKAMEEEVIRLATEAIDNQEETNKDIKAEKKREGKLKYPKISINFNNYDNASEAEKYIQEKLRIKDTEIKIKNNNIALVVRNITDTELNKINRYYKAGIFVGMLNNGTETVINSLTDGIDYTAKNIISPTAKIGLKGATAIGSSLTSTAVKLGATTIDAVSKASIKTANDIKNDKEILRATNDLISLKDTIKRKFFKGINANTKGITIEYEEAE